MNFLTKKNFLYKLIICLCIVLAIMNSSGIQRVYAAEGNGIGGVLINPICDLLLGLGDGIMNIIQKSIMNTEAIVTVDNSDPAWWESIVAAMVVVLVIAVIVAVAIYAPAVLAAALKAVTGALVKATIYFAGAGLVLGLGTTTSGLISLYGIASDALSDTIAFPTFSIGPEEIFSGRILLFDANIFNPKEVLVDYATEDGVSAGTTSLKDYNNWDTDEKSKYHATSYYYYSEEDADGDGVKDRIETSTNNSAYELSDTIARWYYIIRTIALVGSMLILLYIGIRIILSSIAEEKAKYKQMLSDWVVALCLIVLMHYIMVFAHNIVDSITDILTSKTLGKNVYMVTIDEPKENLKKGIEELEKESGMDYLSEDGSYINWPTNLMGKFRLASQQYNDTMEHAGYTMAYLALVLFTLVFSFTYIKRLLYLLFLTVIAPLVALTYPIDKIHDGKAQAFDMWLKEYIFNLLIQPFHLLLYTIFVTMAFELASTNVIYSLVVIGFMVPAEKFLRTMFGFNKASSPGLFAGATGAAITMSAINSLEKFAKGNGHGGNNSKGKENGTNDENARVRTADSNHSQASLFEAVANGEGGNQNENSNENLEQERERLESERSVLDEFLDEGTTPGANWTDEDYAAYEELEREQLEQEARLRQREEQARARNNASSAQAQTSTTSSSRQTATQSGQGQTASNTSQTGTQGRRFRTIFNARQAASQRGQTQQQTTPNSTSQQATTPIRQVQTQTVPNSTTQQTTTQSGQSQQQTQNGKRKVKGSWLRATGQTIGRELNPVKRTNSKSGGEAILKIAGSVAKTAAETTVKAGGLVAGTMLGGVTGMVDGSLKTTYQNAIVGGTAGTTIASGITNRIDNKANEFVKESKDMHEQWKKDYYGEDYSKAMRYKADEEFRKNKEIRKLYKQELGLKDKKAVDAAMKDAIKYREYGINDDNIIIKAMKLDNGNPQNRADNRRIAAAKLAENTKSAKDLETNMKLFSKTPKIEQDQVTDMENLVRQITGI